MKMKVELNLNSKEAQKLYYRAMGCFIDDIEQIGRFELSLDDNFIYYEKGYMKEWEDYDLSDCSKSDCTMFWMNDIVSSLIFKKYLEAKHHKTLMLWDLCEAEDNSYRNSHYVIVADIKWQDYMDNDLS